MKRTVVKVVASGELPGRPNWPHINFDFEKKTEEIVSVIRSENPDMDFEAKVYYNVSDAHADYENDKKRYDGVLTLDMTCGKGISEFYARKSKEEGGIPNILADVLYCGGGAAMCRTNQIIRAEKLPVPLYSTSDLKEIAEAVRMFECISKMKQTTILVVDNKDKTDQLRFFKEKWGVNFVVKTGAEAMEYVRRADRELAERIADKWIKEAREVVEPTIADVVESAMLHVAIKDMMKDTGADAVTVSCLDLSYDGHLDGAHMYPCLSHYEMLNNGTVAVCEADIGATITSLVIKYLTGRPGFVSDPVIDTSCNQIIYAHCVSCTKIYGPGDSCTCAYAIRSHAEDKRGASVQTYFPENRQLTTLFVCPHGINTSMIHSSKSVGNVGLQEGCRSKLAAETNAQALLEKWSYSWHRVTVFGEYRKLFMNMMKMKNIPVIEEDKN